MKNAALVAFQVYPVWSWNTLFDTTLVLHCLKLNAVDLRYLGVGLFQEVETLDANFASVPGPPSLELE